MARQDTHLTQTGAEVQALLNKVEGIEAGAQVNDIEKIKVNGTEQEVIDKTVDIAVPTSLSNLSDDTTHRLVTDTEKAAWDAKADETDIPDVSNFVTKTVSDLTNYYLKTETYTKDEVAALIRAIQQFHYEIYASTAAVTNPQGNVLYLIGPTGTGEDRYEEYVYDSTKATPWVKIGDTSIDLSNYVTTSDLDTALSAYTTSADLDDLLDAKQDVINDLDDIRDGAAAGATAYQKPQTGIPASDLAAGVIPTVPTDVVKYSSQSLTDAQKGQARTNIGAGTYSKPSGGIPKTDLDNGVKASLELADSAIQPAEFNELEEEVGTIGNGAYEEAWDGSSAPVVADIPAGVSVTYSSTSYTGTLAASASTVDKIYLVSDGNGNYDRYVTVESGGTYSWKKVGTTAIPLSNYATKSEVSQLGQEVTENATNIDLLQNQLDNYQPIVIEGNVTNAPDEEDITTDENNLMKFANRAATVNYDGYVILRRGASFAEQVTVANTIYEIRYDFDLDGETVSIPAGSVFKFVGGSVFNGTLSGILYSDEPIDAKSIGIKYNDSNAAATNTSRLKILSGVTNLVSIALSGNIYLGGGSQAGKVIWEYLNINGNDFNIYVNGFSGFRVKKDIHLSHCNVISSQSPVAEFIELTNIGTYHPSVTVKDNYFEGDLRVITANSLSSEQNDVFINEVRIQNNHFENIHFSIFGNCIFSFSDSAFLNFYVENNVVHNMFSQFIGCGVANESTTDHHATWIYNFYLSKGRSFYIRNNKVWNDLDYKPWTKFSATAYFVFILAETGYCLYEYNEVRNLIDKQRDGESSDNQAHDSYLSVDVLDYNNNIIEDCWKYEAGFHIFKSKESNGGNGSRVYSQNTYIAKDMTSLVDYIPTNVKAFLSTQFSVKTLSIENNTFDLQYYGTRASYINNSTYFTFSNNRFKTQTIDGNNYDVCICNSGSNCRQILIENNIVDLVTPPSGAYSFGLFVDPSSSAVQNCKIRISNNILHNCRPIGGDNVPSIDANSMVYIGGNVVSIDDHSYNYNGYGALGGNVQICNDTNKLAKLYTNKTVSYNYMEMEDVIFEATDIGGTSNLLFRSAYVGTPATGDTPIIYEYVLDIKFLNSGYRFKTSLNVTKELSDGAYKNYVLACLYDGTISKIGTTGDYYLFNFEGACTNGTSTANNRRMTLSLSASRVELGIRPFAGDKMQVTFKRRQLVDFHRMNEYINSGTTSQRPAILSLSSVGLSFFDETLNKPIYAKAVDSNTGAVTWGDATGTTVS